MHRFTQDFRVRIRDKKRKKKLAVLDPDCLHVPSLLDSEHKCTVNTVRDTESSALSWDTHKYTKAAQPNPADSQEDGAMVEIAHVLTN